MKQVFLDIDVNSISKYIPENTKVLSMFESHKTDFIVNDMFYKIPYLYYKILLDNKYNRFVFIDEDDKLPDFLNNKRLSEDDCDIIFNIVQHGNMIGWAIDCVVIKS